MPLDFTSKGEAEAIAAVEAIIASWIGWRLIRRFGDGVRRVERFEVYQVVTSSSYYRRDGRCWERRVIQLEQLEEIIHEGVLEWVVEIDTDHMIDVYRELLLVYQYSFVVNAVDYTSPDWWDLPIEMLKRVPGLDWLNEALDLAQFAANLQASSATLLARIRELDRATRADRTVVYRLVTETLMEGHMVVVDEGHPQDREVECADWLRNQPEGVMVPGTRVVEPLDLPAHQRVQDLVPRAGDEQARAELRILIAEVAGGTHGAPTGPSPSQRKG